MQWDKVKNTLIVILLAVNLFLMGSLGAKLWQDRQREQMLLDNLTRLLAHAGLTLDEDFALPRGKVLPLLSLDRSRAGEEAVAAAMLGEEVARTEQEDGAARFESRTGTLEWRADGTVRAACLLEGNMPTDERQALARARGLLADWGLLGEEVTLAADGLRVTVTGTLAGQPVYNRSLELRFDRGCVMLSGRWSFGTPYTTVRGDGTTYAAADALLAFAAAAPEGARIRVMTAGYRLQLDGSRRLQLVPTWKINTDSGEYLVDCAKKTMVAQEN